MTRLLIIGDGRMARAIDGLAVERGHSVVAMLSREGNVHGDGIVEFASRVDVAIEVTTPESAQHNIRACLMSGLPVVVGSTGWQQERPALEALARERNGALLIASNFSLGVAIVESIMRHAAAAVAERPMYEVAMIETHHSAKRDAPSGTAITLRDGVQAALGRPVAISSVRVGSVPGTHSLVIDGPFEQIVITHEARDRRVFADGALAAAAWLVDKHGVFGMHDVTRSGDIA
jgi:4-hydroxy-tetrahydrodipicolinate reductase